MNKLIAEKCREQFEAHIRNLDGDYNLIRAGEVYIDVEDQIEWRTWQAACNKALEIALPILDQHGPGDGEWIHWGGGECPVAGTVYVEVKFRNSDAIEAEWAMYLQWAHKQRITDIIAYRVLKS